MMLRFALLTFVAVVLAGCATRQVNPPITEVHPDEGYRFLAVRFSAFALDGHMFETVEAAQLAIGEAIHQDARS